MYSLLWWYRGIFESLPLEKIWGKVLEIPFSTLPDIYKALECQPGDLPEYLNDKDYKKLMRI